MPRISAFRDYVRQDEAAISAAVGALLFARHEYPDMDADLYIGRLDAFGRSVARRLEGPRDPYQSVRRLNQLCFEEEGLIGDTRTYYDPRNSFLNEVMDRRRGIPISLSVIYLEVAARCALPIRGVPFPGHFIVKYDHPEAPLYIDPFNAGRLLSRDELRAMLARFEGRDAVLRDAHLRASGPRDILFRMLVNLKRLYLEARSHDKVFWVTECLLAIDADSAEDVRDHGMAALGLRRYPEALASFMRYAALSPHADDVQRTMETIRDLRRLVAQMN
jgi:regulator of sirC expression with transglutaminase-like and TPR domain